MSVKTDLLASIVEVVAQSLVYGIFMILMPISTAILIKRGWKTRNGLIMLAMIWIMFTLSTAHWAVNVAFLVAKAKALVVVNGSIRATSDLMNAIVTINFWIADAVVLWRAWVVCKEAFRKVLLVAYGCLCLTAVGIIVTIALRVAVNAQENGQERDNNNNTTVRALDVVQIVSIGISMLTNVVTTVIFGLYVW
ncbi:hypothetical protein PHLGIDRAFT_176108 [Phlebiopsis gigantea 11061_1 CR5-6]|uniref:Uncharacterized protein n=1 Tax=Phlebiopsis gigantea (strain 11061_1 CR5-6) TaxID=745531 RepID=A0A0C3NJ89_PHLG1|nr:hypothetical protein PHLGIDRAFT_176108 [Phlebiopsis gigantea 11061_1 CR5-6]